VDGASILFEVAMRAKETDDDLVMLSLSHRDGNVIVVDNSISSYQDLKGRTIAIPHRLSPQNTLLRIVLERENIKHDEINIIEISPAEMPFSMASGTISAYIVAEPYGSVAVSTGAGRILETSDEAYPDSVCCVMVFRKELFEADGEIKTWILGQFEAAALKAQQKDGAVLDVFKRHSSFSDSVIKNSLLNISYDNLYLSEEEYDRITDIILRYEVLSDVPRYEDFVCCE
jgi:NitT/TauT family transport system substrate-binding protein